MDFSDYPRNRKFYGGANGLKNCIIINGDAFLLKTIPLIVMMIYIVSII